MVRLRFSPHGSHRTVLIGSHGSRFCGADISDACNQGATLQDIANPSCNVLQDGLGNAARCAHNPLVHQRPAQLQPLPDNRSPSPVRHLYTYGVCALATASRPRPADAVQPQVSSFDVFQYLFKWAPVPNAPTCSVANSRCYLTSALGHSRYVYKGHDCAVLHLPVGAAPAAQAASADQSMSASSPTAGRPQLCREHDRHLPAIDSAPVWHRLHALRTGAQALSSLFCKAPTLHSVESLARSIGRSTLVRRSTSVGVNQ